MRLENVVFQVPEPTVAGRFWTSALGLAPLTEPADPNQTFEARLTTGGCWLDLCFESQPSPEPRDLRLHLDLHPAGDQQATVQRLVEWGATHADIGQGDVPWVVLADPAGIPFCVLEERDYLATTGPLASLPMYSADPQRDKEFWVTATGWVEVDGGAPVSLQHPDRRGPLLELCPEPDPKRHQNRLHLDVRPEPGETQQRCVEDLLGRGAAVVTHDWGELPWVVMQDPSGNEFCVLGEPS